MDIAGSCLRCAICTVVELALSNFFGMHQGHT